METISSKSPPANLYIGKELDTLKICIKCNKYKTLDLFYICAGYYNSTCKECSKVRATQWKRDNVEHQREYKRNWYKNNVQKCKNIQKRSLAKRTPEKIQQQKEYFAIKSAQYYQENKERLAALRLIRDRKE